MVWTATRSETSCHPEQTPGHHTDTAEAGNDASVVLHTHFDGGIAMITSSYLESDLRHGGASRARFFRHYAEMVVAMFLGMFILGLPAGWLFSAVGTSWSRLSPAAMLFAMAVTMAVPMAAWMHYRGHTWRLNLEMVGSMLLPTVALMALLWARLVAGMGMLMVVEHAAMLSCMLVAMLLRRDEYSGGACARRQPGERAGTVPLIRRAWRTAVDRPLV